MINQIFEKVNKIHGWFSKQEMGVLYPFVKDLPSGSLFVEIGTWRGRSTLFFTLANPNINILTIDDYATEWQKRYIQNEQDFTTHIDTSVLNSGRIFQVVGDSTKIVDSFNWKIDFLFVDGDHEDAGLSADIEKWSKLVKKDCHIAFHDAGKTKATIDKWLADNENTFERVKNENDILIIKKL